MITEIIVWTSVAFTLAFVGAWLWSSDMRSWIEQPKYRFLTDVRAYDRRQDAAHDGAERRR